MASADASAAERYRYKDPFGTWRVIKLPDGYAKHFQRARQGTAVHAGRAPSPLPDRVARARRIERLLEQGGLISHGTLVAKAAKASGVDKSLLLAVIAIESGFRPDARSPKGALGLMQLMPGTAAGLVDSDNIESALFDPATNLKAGSLHLRRLLDQYPGRIDLALAAYNAGQGAVEKYYGIPPYVETQQYVRDVMALYTQYQAARLDTAKN